MWVTTTTEGGTRPQVQFLGEGTNLHKLWDSDLIRHVGGNDHAWLERIEKRINPETVKTWSRGTVEDWANESLQAAKVAYHDPKDTREDNKPMPTGTTLEKDYLTRAEPILEVQMARASVRLAAELNTIFR